MSASAAPQLPQNLVPEGFSAPHAVQEGSSDAPQSPQNFLPVGLEIPQLGQSMVASVRTSAARLGGRAPARQSGLMFAARITFSLFLDFLRRQATPCAHLARHKAVRMKIASTLFVHARATAVETAISARHTFVRTIIRRPTRV